MRFALKELRRRPGRFVAAAMILALVSLLIVYLGGIIDGTVRAGTGALRALDGRLLVYSRDSQLAVPDSRIDSGLRRQVASLDGVARADGLGITQLAGRLPGQDGRAVLDLTVVGYEAPTNKLPTPPAPGTAYADRSLAGRGITVGSQLLVGTARTPLTIVGFVSDTTFDGQSTLWTTLDTWRAIQTVERPLRAPGTDGVQVLVVTPASTSNGLAARIDAATADATRTVTPDGAVAGLPGVEGTRSVFTAVIVFTTFIGIVVVALLFALLVVERIGLYGVLKALGVRSTNLFLALAFQAITIALIAVLVGSTAGVALGSLLTSGNSAATFTTSRLVASAALVVGAAVLGAGITLRRVLRIDPASAIGTAS